MKENILYFECYSGISGDMTVSALLDLGVDEAYLLNALDSLKLEGYEIEISRLKKCGIDGCHFDVILDSEKHSHTHEEHSHTHEGHSHTHGEHSHTHEGHSHTHGEHSHTHGEHSHTHEEHSHTHEENSHTHEEHSHTHDGHSHGEHRNLSDVLLIIEKSGISEQAKKIAKDMFFYVAKAEAKAHALPVEQVHFHEVGAVDSIVDIVAAAVCIDFLKIEKICVSTVYEGQGFVRCQHGVIPVPVPAVVNIASECGISLRITENRGEMITPTGMAILASLKNQEKLPDEYVIKKVGIGTGKKDFKQANILRIMHIEADLDDNSEKETVEVLETNLDDCSGETLGYAMELLLQEGAKDVFFTPIFMKKNRPATKLTILYSGEKKDILEDIVFQNLTTIGIRSYSCTRTVLPREILMFQSSLGAVQFKLCQHKGNQFAYPEYEDIKKICLSENLPFQATYDKIKGEYIHSLVSN